MDKPVVAQKGPYAVEVEEGQKVFWCTCGRSAKQPFCDGAHKPTTFRPLIQVMEKGGTVYLCGCKATKDQPFCDGSHSTL